MLCKQKGPKADFGGCTDVDNVAHEQSVRLFFLILFTHPIHPQNIIQAAIAAHHVAIHAILPSTQ